jgi:hypothetical protein
MNYYVRRTDESKIEGPFTVEQINQMFEDKLLDLNSTGIADTGQDIRQVANSKKGWVNLIHVRGVTGDFPTSIYLQRLAYLLERDLECTLTFVHSKGAAV